MSLFPNRSGDALLVVDAQVDVMRTCWQPRRVVATIDDLVGRARLAGAPVVWVRHNAVGFEQGSDGWQIVPELIPEPGEAVVEKRWGDSFAETDLDDVLAELEADHVWLVGAQSDLCIRSTFFGGLHRGYDMTLVGDAHTTEPASEGTVRLSAEQLVAMVNRLAWTTRLPGVEAGLATSDEVCFSPASAMDDDDRIEAVEADHQADEDAEDVELGLADDEDPGAS